MQTKNIDRSIKIMIDDGLFDAANVDENKTTKDFQRCVSLHKQLQQSWSSCKSYLIKISLEIENYTHEVCGNLVAVESKLERVADEKCRHDHSHCQSDCHLPSLRMKKTVIIITMIIIIIIISIR